MVTKNNLPKISFAHHINNSNARNAALALSENGLLHKAITTVAYQPDSSFGKLLQKLPAKISQPLQKELSRRIWTEVDVTTYPLQEIVRIFLARTKLTSVFGLENADLTDWVYRELDKQIAQSHLEGIGGIYLYEDLAATTFEKAKEKGILCFYDLPIPYYKIKDRVMIEERSRFPHLSYEIDDLKPEKLKRKQREVELADHIFVASSITKRSLLEIGVNEKKITVIPYGAPTQTFKPLPKKDDIFRVVYVGRISTRKGIHYLIPAWQQLKLKKAELCLIGGNLFPSGWLEQYRDICRHVPSVPHVLLNEYYSQGSVLVFPSLMEGFGLVILEAMACGIPVITTPNTGGLDIIDDGIDGFIVPIRDVEALKERIQWCYDHPDELAQMGIMARKKAEQLTWGVYRQRLADKVKELLMMKK